MLRRGFRNLAKLPKRLGVSPARLEILALFPLLSISVASIWNHSVAEVTGIVLPVLLILDALERRFSKSGRSGRQMAVDGATGLPSRDDLATALVDVAETEGRKSTACLYVRLDDQDVLAQKWKSGERDEILRRTAERLRTTLRSEDTIARIEDGTFGIVLAAKPSKRPDDAMAIAERITASAREPIHLGDRRASVSVSVGVATPGPLEIRELFHGAEAAVADAQRSGPGRVRAYSHELKDRLSREAELIRSVDAALDAGEIRAWFQPQICTDSNMILGFEALARWYHPKFGLLSPEHFLGAISNAGRMPRLGEVMLQNTLAALSSWDRKGLKIPSVSVNFSPEELCDPDLADRIKWEVDRYDIRPGRLCLEILESVAACGKDATILRNVDQFASHGFLLDLDDFGTGQASIQSIRRFRVQRIKIHETFISGIDRNPERQSVVSAILSLAQHLGIDTIAEGVQTPGEHSILSQLGCRGVQGFGIARPMPFEDTFAWIDAHRMRTVQPPEIGRKTG